MSHRASVSLHAWQSLEQVRQVLAHCLADLGGMARFVRPGGSVIMKPNLTANGPEASGGTTHLCLAEAIAEQVLACRPGVVFLAEGTGAFGIAHETAFPTGGWREMATRLGIEIYNLDAGPHDCVPLPNPRFPYPLPVSRLVRDCDTFISLPCLKTHITTDYTVALKNSFCLTPQSQRTEIHRLALIEQALVDLNRVRRPDLIVVDGYDGAEGIAGGTDFERPAGARLMLAADDPVAADVISRDLMSVSQRTRYLEWSIADGVGIGDGDRVDLRGEPVASLRRRFTLPAEELTAIMPGLALDDLDACSGCRVSALAAASRFRYQSLRRATRLVYGQSTGVVPPGDATVIVGNCAQALKAEGVRVPGCPAPAGDIIAALSRLDCFCHDCQALTRDLMHTVDPQRLRMTRLSAAGAEVWQGPGIDRERWHVEVVIGDCMRRYVRILTERARAFGMDPDQDVIWVRGCPPTGEEMRAAIESACRRVEAAPH